MRESIENSIPKQVEDDSTISGDGWFYYWKTPESLWESKIKNYQGKAPIFVPLNWCHHEISDLTYDFSGKLPESNILKIFDLAQSQSKKIFLLLPLTPFPFLPTGGLPASLSKFPALDENKIQLNVVNEIGQIHKFYSFFEPRVYHSFQKMLINLSETIKQRESSVRILGAKCFYIQNGKLISFLEDSSKTFEEGLGRFKDLNRIEEKLNFKKAPPQATKSESISPERLYFNMIHDLYLGSAQNQLKENWLGFIKIGFLGASPWGIFQRSSEQRENVGVYLEEIRTILSYNALPYAGLLGHNYRAQLIDRCIFDLVNEKFIQDQGHAQIQMYDEEFNSQFIPLKLVLLAQNINKNLNKNNSENPPINLDLIHYVQDQYQAVYQNEFKFKEGKTLTNLENESFDLGVLIVKGNQIDKEYLSKIFYYFLSGGKIILDRSGMDLNIARNLEMFIQENSLEQKKINYLSEIHIVALGESSIISYDSQSTLLLSDENKNMFWDSLFKLVRLLHLKILKDDGIREFWKRRMPSHHESQFLEIRRLELYNPTSYRKKVLIPHMKNFHQLKISEKLNCEIHNSPEGINIQLYPNALLVQDFGISDD
jgi:hypothetical protein